MQFNGSGLNSAPIDGSRKYLVNTAASAAVLIYSDLSSNIYKHGSSTAPLSLVSEFRGSACRFGIGSNEFNFTAELAQTIYRQSGGAAAFSLDTNLFWTRTVYGFGTAVLEFDITSLIGVVYLEGTGIMLPMNSELEGIRIKEGSGDATAGLFADLFPSAIRNGVGTSTIIGLNSESDATHVTAGGIRYIGASADFAISLDAIDSGMLRQAHIGSCDVYLVGEGSGVVTRVPSISPAILGIGLEADFTLYRKGSGAAELLIVPELNGAVYVRGEGQIALPILASFRGSKTTHNTLTAVLEVTPQVSSIVQVRGGGTAIVSLVSDLTLTRLKQIEGEATIVLLDTSNGYINHFAVDKGAFVKSPIQRTFNRVDTAAIWRK